ncbi:Sorting nexin-16 [Senna tora]|uniref:Sorting nexin-16 n=1 Tax=Senna tora TaxID=362788 RepID=A0A834T5N0_9FABA|nr:Sorting nexin-16 [Senna tora]
MSTPNRATVRDLVEEAKKRIVFLIICVVGLSYLMSFHQIRLSAIDGSPALFIVHVGNMVPANPQIFFCFNVMARSLGYAGIVPLTSSSVWVNLPAAASLIIILRYLSLDFDMKRKAAVYNNKPGSGDVQSSKKPIEFSKVVARSDWREKVNSPVVEDAIDHFSRHLISEWVTDLWYSRLTPDKEGPEELVQIINGVLGEISGRARNINLIDLLIRDLITLICTHLELFRAAQAKIELQHSGSVTCEDQDAELKRVMAAENKLHPALLSAEAEHKVLQHLMDALMSVTFKPEDLQCAYFRYTARELLACAVMRPVLNLASPRFINERIESVAINMTKVKGATAVQEASHSKSEELQMSPDHFSIDPSVTGVELVQLRNSHSKKTQSSSEDNANDKFSKDPLLAINAQSSRSWNSLHANSQTSDDQGIQQLHSGGEWGDILDRISHRKTQVLAPENLENMWTKGKNYKHKEEKNQSNKQVPHHSLVGKSLRVGGLKALSGPQEKDTCSKVNSSKGINVDSGHSAQFRVENTPFHANRNGSTYPSITSDQDDEDEYMHLQTVDSGSTTSYNSEDEETSNVTGLDSPVTKVWDGKSNRNHAVSHIHHPLENFDVHSIKKVNKRHSRYQRLPRAQSGWKRSRPSGHKVNTWQEVERTSFLSGDGQDILSSIKTHTNSEDSSDEADTENLGRIHSGAAASSSASFISKSESSVNSLKSSLAVDSFFKLRCEVLGANIVKSDSRTFAVYSISVTDVNNNSWTIKRRFRHFEELHRRLKLFPEYNLHLPPKHFLSTGLDVPVIQERCKLLDKYLKELMQLPTVSGSIEVWDFLSVDSQTYLFSNSFSIIQTLSVDLHDKPSEKTERASNLSTSASGPLASRKENYSTENKEAVLRTRNNFVADGLRSKEFPGSNADTRAGKNAPTPENLQNTVKRSKPDGSDEAANLLHKTSSDTIPTEWVPPNLSVPILDLVDVIFQVQDGGWMRRKAFWVAKQVLQLGMGDAFDDWLIEKIQLLRKGSVVASGISRVEQILWPDGIFITKHPKRRPPPPSPSQNLPPGQEPPVASPKMDDEQKMEADRRAKFVYELIIDHAPSAIVGLVGRKEYEQCARDLYFFLQSSVCLRQLAFDLLELLILSAFPELDYAFKQLHEERHKFSEPK